ncbi:MAG: hypothetical protein GY756_18230, partial [bacterium]|nr:hypothetical protein [bacterium]
GGIEGNIHKNKTVDILCIINEDEIKKIAIEVKFDKSIKLGDIADKNIFTNKYDTAWSQLIETQANRGTVTSVIVFDIALVDKSITDKFDNVGYIPQVGFIAVVDSQKGNFNNLVIAYMLARDIVLNSKPDKEYDVNTLGIIVSRIIKTLSDIKSIERLVNTNIKNNQEILKQIEKSMLLMEFNEQYLSKFLKDGVLTQKDLLEFYSGEEIKDEYKNIINERI